MTWLVPIQTWCVLAVALLLAGCDAPAPSLPTLAPDARVLAFGDSLTFGSGARAEESYPAVLATRIGREVIRSGVPGELSSTGLERLRSELARHRPALVILCHGANDLLRKRPVGALTENLTQMIALVRASGAEVLLVGVPQPSLGRLHLAPVYTDVAAANGVPLEGEALPRILSDDSLKSDGFHPNAEGYARLAAAVSAALEMYGALR
ncbi:MAG: GDSL-type esterase/lipase family protein [Gammaproteobacteria bacterium]